MGIHSFSRQNSFALEQECSWDPTAVLGIINRDTRGFTCVGYAPSQGRRCRNPIAQCNRERVFDMLDTLALSPSNSRKVASMLPKIAALSLCRRHHQNQADGVVDEWQTRIVSMKPRKGRTHSWLVDEDAGVPERPREKARASRPTPAQEKQRWREEDEQSQRQRARLEEEIERMREELERLRNIKQEKEREAKESEEKENQAKKEKERQDEEKKEQKRKEQEKKDQERREQEKKAQQEQEARDQKERIAREAKRKREERERQERAKAAKEKEEWEKTWENYERRWVKFKTASAPPVQGGIHTAIPWPVKSGQYADVKEKDAAGAKAKKAGVAMVEEFFRKGCLEMGTPAEAYRLMGEESKKWHPDKLAALFKGVATGAEEKEVVTMIGQVVIKLRLEAKRLRDEARGD